MTATPFRPGNRVRAVDTRPHANFLRLYATYTVDLVSPDGRRVGLANGPARMWDADQFVRVEETQHAEAK
jgi:hypothetical protein